MTRGAGRKRKIAPEVSGLATVAECEECEGGAEEAGPSTNPIAAKVHAILAELDRSGIV